MVNVRVLTYYVWLIKFILESMCAINIMLLMNHIQYKTVYIIERINVNNAWIITFYHTIHIYVYLVKYRNAKFVFNILYKIQVKFQLLILINRLIKKI